MPLQIPTLDDRNFEQLLAEAKRRIPVHAPEWTNFEGESDPGITIVELFAFITESLIYRANRVPELNRLKFLELLDVPLRPAAAAKGIVSISPDRGPVAAVTLGAGVILAAGNVRFLTTDGVSVLPVEAHAYYKRPILPTDPSYASYQTKYAAVAAAKQSALDDLTDPSASATSAASTPDNTAAVLAFYETLPVPLPTASDPNPSLSLATDTLDQAIYLALLAPANVTAPQVREAIAGKTLSIGIVPDLTDTTVPPLEPRTQPPGSTPPPPALIFEIADASGAVKDGAKYRLLPTTTSTDVLNAVGVVEVTLPAAKSQLTLWEFSEPLDEGIGDFPPRLEDDQISSRLVTWIRLRLPTDDSKTTSGGGSNQPATTSQNGSLDAQLSWVGINAVDVVQAVPVFNAPLGTGTGTPDQTVRLANTPVLIATMLLQVQNVNNVWEYWRQVDDLLAAGPTDQVYAIDPESGVVTFGDGLTGARPGPLSGIRASYQYGGGVAGNVAAGAIKSSPDPRLQGAFKIANPVATWGGTEGESIDQAQQRIPQFIRHRDRLVTAQDFKDVTLRAAGVNVGRVEVIPLHHPPTFDVPSPPENTPGTVTVMVIPASDARNPLWPLPDRLFLLAVCQWLEPRRLVTTELFVRGPEYVSIYLSVGVEILPGHFRDVVIAAVTDRLRRFLSSLPPGGSDGQGWPLRKNVLAKELEAVADRVEGVDFVEALLMGTGNPVSAVDPLVLKHLQLPLLALINVVQGTPTPLSQLTGAVQANPATLPIPVTRSKC